MSGGTDSSVAALLLQDAGYEVTGVTFRFYEKEGDTEYLDDARTLCERLKIKHISYDVRNMFRETIIDYFIREYMAGHTPVPCTLCNNNLKWPLLQQLADELGIYHLLPVTMSANVSSTDFTTSLPEQTLTKTSRSFYGGFHKIFCNGCCSLWVNSPKSGFGKLRKNEVFKSCP